MASENELPMYRALFEAADTNNDGFLTSEELGSVLNSFGEKIPQKQINVLVRMVDRDNNGKLDFSEFLDILEGNIGDFETEDEIRRFFRVFDRNNTGFLTKEDLRDFVEAFDEQITETELEELMKKVDTNGDGKINIEEYTKYMLEKAMKNKENAKNKQN